MDAYELFNKMEALKTGTWDRLELFNEQAGILYITRESDYYTINLSSSIGMAILADHIVPINGTILELQDSHHQKIGAILSEKWKEAE